MRRRTLRWATLALALAGLTCRDADPIGPRAPGRAAFDVSGLALFAPGDPPVPVESLEVVYREAHQIRPSVLALRSATGKQSPSPK